METIRITPETLASEKFDVLVTHINLMVEEFQSMKRQFETLVTNEVRNATDLADMIKSMIVPKK